MFEVMDYNAFSTSFVKSDDFGRVNVGDSYQIKLKTAWGNVSTLRWHLSKKVVLFISSNILINNSMMELCSPEVEAVVLCVANAEYQNRELY